MWSKPYKEAGYEVMNITAPKYDVKTFHPPENVYGILAAPPCTMFSMARTVAKKPRDLQSAMEIVSACLRIIWESQYKETKLKFWALENPKARLRWFLGKPAVTFNPYDYGDPYKKPTDLWGNFNEPRRNAVGLTVEQLTKSKNNTQTMRPIPKDYVRDKNMSLQAIRRSMTHEGFAQAFFKANK